MKEKRLYLCQAHYWARMKARTLLHKMRRVCKVTSYKEPNSTFYHQLQTKGDEADIEYDWRAWRHGADSGQSSILDSIPLKTARITTVAKKAKKLREVCRLHIKEYQIDLPVYTQKKLAHSGFNKSWIRMWSNIRGGPDFGHASQDGHRSYPK